MKKHRGKVKKMAIPDELKQAVLRSLEAEIRKKGWNPSQLARELGHSPAWLSLILRGERGMDLFDFIKISEVLGSTPQEILRDYPAPVLPPVKPNSKEVAALLLQAIPADVLKSLLELAEKKPD